MLLLEIFANICSLGMNFISELMASILPLELARELQDPATGDDDDDDDDGEGGDDLLMLWSNLESQPTYK